MHRTGRAVRRLAKGLLQIARQLVDHVDVGMHLGYGCVKGRVLDLLIGVAVPGEGRLAARDRKDRRPVQPGILQARGKVGGTDRLRHADANAAGHPRVGVGHIGRRLFRVCQHAGDPDLLHLDEGAPQDRVHEEDVGHAEVLESFRDIACAGDLVAGHEVMRSSS